MRPQKRQKLTNEIKEENEIDEIEIREETEGEFLIWNSILHFEQRPCSKRSGPSPCVATFYSSCEVSGIPKGIWYLICEYYSVAHCWMCPKCEIHFDHSQCHIELEEEVNSQMERDISEEIEMHREKDGKFVRRAGAKAGFKKRSGINTKQKCSRIQAAGQIQSLTLLIGKK
jgi:hypothetical protein